VTVRARGPCRRASASGRMDVASECGVAESMDSTGGRGRIPAARRPLIGREAEVTEILGLLNGGAARCVSLVGPAGVGKTSVADEVMRRLGRQGSIAIDRFGLTRRPGKNEIDALSSCLGCTGGPWTPPLPPPQGRRRVVFVDGADAEAVAAAISTALDCDPDLNVLLAGFGRVGLAGEHIVPIGPLALPDEGCRTPARAMKAPAVELLCATIREGDQAYRLTTSDVAAVVTLCRELDGHPLALALAGARCRTLSVSRVLELWNTAGPRALRGRASDGPDRHRALPAAIQASWQELPMDARQALRRLSVFVGPFTWEAALAVLPAGGQRSQPEEKSRLGEALDHLVDSGLVRRDSTRDPGRVERYFLPRPIQRFAADRSDAFEVADARRRHADFYRDVACSATSSWWNLGQARRTNLAMDRQDLLAALDFVAEADTAEKGLSFAVDLEPLWLTLGGTSGTRRIESMLDRLGTEDPEGSLSRAVLEAQALTTLVTLRVWSPTPVSTAQAREILDRAIALASSADRVDVARRARAAEVQALLLHGVNDAARDIAVAEASDAHADGDVFAEMCFRRWAAVAENNAGNRTPALQHAIVARDLAQCAGDNYQVLMSSHVMAGIAGAETDPHAHLPSSDELLAMARRLGEDRLEGMVLFTAAVKSNLSGQAGPAARQILEILELTHRIGEWHLQEVALFALVSTAHLAGEEGLAAELHGSIRLVLLSLRRRLPPPLMRAYDVTLNAVEEKLGRAEFERRSALGGRLSWTEAIVRAEEIAASLDVKCALDNDRHESQPSASDVVSETNPLLTTRDRQILELLSVGASNKEIAAQLGLRPKTVMHYSSALYRKLGVRSRAEAVGAAWTRGILFPTEPAIS
jgi:predicted ATPase/DNA-binding CsgD family transcriptional regulator